VAAPEFLFAIELSGPVPPRDMIRDLASQILAHAGLPNDEAPTLVDALHAAVDRSGSAGGVSCRVRFHAHDGTLEIDVTSGDTKIWSDSRRFE
jgi:hypothetical protein